MEFGEALIARASASSAITSIVGNRIYWAKRPQGSAAPALVFEAAGGFEDLPLTEEAEFFERRLNGHCYGSSHAQAWSLARAVRATFREPEQVAGFDFMDSDISLPIDGGEDTPQGYVHDAVLDMVVRHGAES
jgi:hypothetical protein